MPETGHATKADLIREVTERLGRLGEQTARMQKHEREFVLGMIEKLATYKDLIYVSPNQLFWMRDLDERYTPDPRQGGLF